MVCNCKPEAARRACGRTRGSVPAILGQMLRYSSLDLLYVALAELLFSNSRRDFSKSSSISPISKPTARAPSASISAIRSEEHTSELQSPCNLVCRLLLEKKKKNK